MPDNTNGFPTQQYSNLLNNIQIFMLPCSIIQNHALFPKTVLYFPKPCSIFPNWENRAGGFTVSMIMAFRVTVFPLMYMASILKCDELFNPFDPAGYNIHVCHHINLNL